MYRCCNRFCTNCQSRLYPLDTTEPCGHVEDGYGIDYCTEHVNEPCDWCRIGLQFTVSPNPHPVRSQVKTSQGCSCNKPCKSIHPLIFNLCLSSGLFFKEEGWKPAAAGGFLSFDGICSAQGDCRFPFAHILNRLRVLKFLAVLYREKLHNHFYIYEDDQ